MTRVLLDANFLVAWLDPRDTLHSIASEIDDALGDRAERLIVDVVVGETLSVVARRCEEQKRSGEFLSLLDFFRSYAPESRLVWVSPSVRELYNGCIDILHRHRGRLNFNDALISLFMKQNHVQHLASFDADFDELPEIYRISTVKSALAL
jgi:predicted nucleic acid-binding protein